MARKPVDKRLTDIRRQVGASVKERRLLLGLTQVDLGGMVGVSYQQLHKYENGTNRIPAEKLLVLAEALGVKVDTFFEGVRKGAAAISDPTQQRALELVEAFHAIESERGRVALHYLAQTMAGMGK